jgi:hypothetical protein
MTALHAYQDNKEIVDLLVRGGANVKAANRYGVTRSRWRARTAAPPLPICS